jgi:hypothetical protein
MMDFGQTRFSTGIYKKKPFGENQDLTDVHRILRKTGTAYRVELIDLCRSPGEMRLTRNETLTLAATA